MMRTTGYRVRQVLSGHSSTAVIVAVDTQGREVRLEVGALEGASIQVDEVLVLSWATVVVPQASGSSATEREEEPLLGRELEEVEPPVDDPVAAIDRELKEIQALVGLRD